MLRFSLMPAVALILVSGAGPAVARTAEGTPLRPAPTAAGLGRSAGGVLAGLLLLGASFASIRSPGRGLPREPEPRVTRPPGPISDSFEILPVTHGPWKEARCPVCSRGFDSCRGFVARCDRCQVPSHTECWEFQGGCAVFACDRRPRPATAGGPG